MSEGSTRATLPPLHLAAQQPNVAPERPRAPSAEIIQRRVGPKAEEANLRARLALARKKNDAQGALVSLARWLGAHGRDVRGAVALAREGLAQRDDGELRREAAQWLETIGEFHEAARMLEGGTPDAPTWVRVGVLRARAGDAEGARAALTRAAEADPTDAMPLELEATLASLGPDVVTPSRAAEAYVEGARRRRSAGAIQGEMEDLLRAFEADPTSDVARDALADALTLRGRHAAAEEVFRASASARGGGPAEHAQRFDAALASGDVLRALDAGLSADLDVPPDAREVELASGFDDVLVRVGLFELLAARLEIAAERAEGPARMHVLEQIARLCAGPLAAPERAARANVQILAGDPSREDALLALRAYATQTRDLAPFVEGLVRGAAAEDGDLLGRLRCARVLAALAEDQLHDPKLARWAWSIASAIEPEDVGAADALRRLGGAPEDDAWKKTLDEELVAAARTGGLGRFLLGLELIAPDELEARVGLAASARARGDLRAASDILRPLVNQDQARLRGLAVAWVNGAAAGDLPLVARAMLRTAELCTPAVGAIVLCEAAERFLRAGERDNARRAAERACQVDPAAPRPVATLANVVLGSRDRTAASALERAVAAVFARGAWCSELASALEDLGEMDYCVAWTQRLVALRPGDRAATSQLIARVQRAGDAARLADTLIWALPQPQPAEELGPVIASGLRALTALDAQRAAVVARRALEVFGPDVQELRAAILDAASRAEDHELASLLDERWAEAIPEVASPARVRVARRRMSLGDRDGQVRALLDAVRAGASALDLEPEIEQILGERPQTGDAELARLELLAELRTVQRLAGSAQRAWRELGGALWDLADDREGAIASWMKAARLAPGGFKALGADLVRFGGPQLALGALVETLEHETDANTAGAIAAEAARIALPLGESARAFDLASLALIKNPLLTEALEVAEKGAVAAGRAQEMTKLYEAVAGRALGRFGRRAAHYRGARFFEHRGEDALALRHASQAFVAVPSEGAPLVLLRRIAEKANDLPTAVRTMVEVANVQSDTGLRAGWLVRAAALAGAGEADARLKVDVLLQAAMLVPRTSTLAMLADAAKALLHAAPDERDALMLRFGRAAKTLTARLEGPDGARVALSFVELNCSLFEDAEGALTALEHALGADADVEEYAQLAPHAVKLARAEGAEALLDKLASVVDEPYSNVGVFALRLLGAMAKEIGQRERAAKFFFRAAEREPDDLDLLREADAMVAGAAPKDAERFDKKLPPKRRAAAYEAFAKTERAEGRFESAAAAYERSLQLTPEEERAPIDQALREVYESAGKVEELEKRALREAQNDGLATNVRASRWTEVAHVREQRGDVAAALEALEEAAKLDPDPLERWSALERMATLTGRPDLKVRALREIEVRVKEDARPAVLRRLANAYEEIGDLKGLEATWQRVLEINPSDEEADQEIEAVIGRAGDYERLAAHLQKRAKRLSGISDARETLRVVRLRRVAILEQRLGRAADACKELEQLVLEWPNNESALRYLADLYERTAQHGRAGSVWRHLGELASDETSRTDLELRSAIAAKNDGDLIRAAEWTRAILTRSPGNVDALALLAELARASSDDHTLGAALAGLASSPLEDPIKRSGWLIEAAQAAARGGDAPGALERAQQAAKVAPERAETQLFARGLEYRMRGPGTADQARDTVAELARVQGPCTGDDGALLAFLWAEATDVFEPGSGLSVLEQARARAGDHALISVAIAERQLARGDLQSALDHLQIALNGNLLGLRSRGRVALAGAQAARAAGAGAIAERMLTIAENEPDSRAEAAKARAELEAGPKPSLVLHEASDDAIELEPDTEDEGDRVTPAMDHTEAALREALAKGDPRAGDALVHLLGDGTERADEVVRVRRAQCDLKPGDPRLLALLRQAALADRNPLYARAIDHVLRAFDVGAGAVDPPPLGAQLEQPGILTLLTKPAQTPAGEALALVLEGVGPAFARDPASYGISGVERVQPGPTSVASRLYEIAVRLLDVSTPLYLRRAPPEAARGTSEPRLKTGLAMPKPSVALLAAPAALLTGEVREEAPPILYALGQALAAALPSNALLLGLPEAQARAVWSAMLVSFGPTANARASMPDSARLTTLFWSTIPGRIQRRIQQLLSTPNPGYDELFQGALAAARRVGLFLAGDIEIAVRAACLEPNVQRAPPTDPEELEHLCASVPEVADLVRLALSPEFADARWRVPPDGSNRGRLSSGGLRLK